jgi:magnesium transporter
VEGRPVIEEFPITFDDLKEKFHPDEVKKTAHSCFLDIEIEDLTKHVEENKELVELSEILEISLDTLEEIITDQRPRLDDYVNYVLILFKSVGKHPTEIDEKIEYQVGLEIYDNVVISIHSGIPIALKKIFRIFSRTPLMLISGGITYLLTRYIDALIDPVYGLIENWRKLAENLERKILDQPQKENLDILVTLRQQLFDLVKICQANREVVNRMKSARVPLLQNDFIPPELDDHIKHLLDESDIMRAVISDLMNMHYASESSRLNQTLARFTFIASLILLPTLISGIFGMNNVDFPVISFWWVVLMMGLSMLGLFIIFKKKRLI